MNNNSIVVSKIDRFSILKDEGKFYVYSTNNALLKSGTYEDCEKWAKCQLEAEKNYLILVVKYQEYDKPSLYKYDSDIYSIDEALKLALIEDMSDIMTYTIDEIDKDDIEDMISFYDDGIKYFTDSVTDWYTVDYMEDIKEL